MNHMKTITYVYGFGREKKLSNNPNYSSDFLYGFDYFLNNRYEVNYNYLKSIEKSGITLSGMSPNRKLVEIIERTKHPWFIGVQFHPELKSTPFNPHPIFNSFISAVLKFKNRNK